jgi:hypothetical protein
VANLLTTGVPFAGRYGPDAILSAAGVPVVSTPVTIYQSDGTTLATLYTDNTKATTGPNPVNTDSFGNLAFYANPGIYVLSFTVGGVGSTKTVMVDPWYSDAAWNDYTVTANTTILSGDCVFVDATSGAITITIPTPKLGTRVKVEKIDSSANVVTVTTPSGLILGLGLGAGSASQPLGGQGSYMEIHGDGTNARITAGNADSGWLGLGFANSWSNYGNGYQTVAYRIVGSRVLWRGSMAGGANGTQPFVTLPSAIRPSLTVVMTPTNQVSGGGAGSATFIVGNTGVTSVAYSGSTPVISFDGCSYSLD